MMTVLAAFLAVAIPPPVVVTVSLPPTFANMQRHPVHAEIHAVPTGEHATARESLIKKNIAAEPGSETRVNLSLAEGTWRLDVRGDGYWSPPVLVTVPGTNSPIGIRLWRTAPLFITISSPDKAEIASLNVTFRGTPKVPAGVEASVPQGSRACSLAKGVAACDVPVGRLDLRLEAKGFIPHYLWSYEVRDDRKNALDSLYLEPGASISGFVSMDGGGVVQDAIVEVLTSSGQRIQSLERPNEARLLPVHVDNERYPLQVKTNDRGFFQIRRVEEGEYELAARYKELVGRAPVRVQRGKETRLDDFLVLEPPIEIDVTVEPPTAPDGTTWTLKVVRLEPMPARLHEGPVPVQGSLTIGPVGRGQYSFEVWSGGDRWFGEAVEIAEVPGPLIIRLPVVRVKGRVTLGDRPLPSVVIFGGRGGAVEVTMEADSEGRFRGSLPRSGEWVVSVEAVTPPVSRKLSRVGVEPDPSGEASVSIELANASVTGHVVDEQGSGVSAIVNVFPQIIDDRMLQVRTDPDGTFALHGLPEGAITLSAQAHGRLSEVTSVQAAEDTTQHVTLVLRGEVKVTGRVISARGPVLAGATLLAFPVGVPLTGSRYYTTDPEGRFAFSLPPATRHVAVFYWAPGHALEFLRLPVPDEPLVLAAQPLGGSLVINFGSEVDLFRDTDPVPVVLHGGAQASLRQLLTFSLRRGVMPNVPSSPRLQSVTLPEMAAGDYAVCLQTYANFVANLPVQGRCESGTLLSGGELRVVLPAARSSAAQVPSVVLR